MTILTNLNWSVTDETLTRLVVDDLEVEGDPLKTYLSQPSPLTPTEDGHVYLHYPIRSSQYDPDLLGLDDNELVQYDWDDVGTIGQLLGAIFCYFNTRLTLEQLQNIYGQSGSSYEMIVNLFLEPPETLSTIAEVYHAQRLEGFSPIRPESSVGHYEVLVSRP